MKKWIMHAWVGHACGWMCGGCTWGLVHHCCVLDWRADKEFQKELVRSVDIHGHNE